MSQEREGACEVSKGGGLGGQEVCQTWLVGMCR